MLYLYKLYVLPSRPLLADTTLNAQVHILGSDMSTLQAFISPEWFVSLPLLSQGVCHVTK